MPEPQDLNPGLLPQQSLSPYTSSGPYAERNGNWGGRDIIDLPPDRPGLSIVHYFWVLKRQVWKILALVLAASICTFVISKRIIPIYESTATISVDRQIPTGVVGQEATTSAVNDSEQFLATQVHIIQSDSVIRPVLQHFNLMPPLAAGQTVEMPVELPGLTVTRVLGTYLLKVNYRSPDQNLAAEVANAIARQYREYTFEIRYRASASLSSFMEKQLEELRAKTERSAAALSKYEQEMSMINPEQRTSIISAHMLQLNTDLGAAEADRVQRESVWQSVQSGTLEALEISSQGGTLQAFVERLTEARQKLAELQLRLGVNHPDYKKAALQVTELEDQLAAARQNITKRVETEYRQAQFREDMLRKEFQTTKTEFDELNARSFQYTSLKREADTDRGLYDELVRKIKEAGINVGFQSNSITISDSARPSPKPIYPNIWSNVFRAFLLSLCLAIAAAILGDRLDNTIRDPEEARDLLGTDVVGSLPLVRGWKGKLIPAMTTGKPAEPSTEVDRNGKGSYGRSASGFEEAVQTLRNSILLSSFNRPLKSIMFTSASPSEGKTTISVHFALAHARQKHKTLLIDCDMRRPGVHTKLGVKSESGLAAALLNGLCWRDKLIQVEHAPGLTLLPAGPLARRCADLIGANLKQILAEAESEYDLVVVDSPPLMGFPEPLQMAAAVDGVVLVAVAGETNRRALDSVLSTLRRLRAHVVGLVLNEVSSSTTNGYYYGYYGSYYAKYYESPKE